MGFNVAIDGPAGAGKSTIAKLAAKELNFIYVDTGAMYRGISIYFLDNQIDTKDLNCVKKALDTLYVSIRYEDEKQQVYVNDENVTSRLRMEEVGNMASIVSAIPEVRAKLLELQKGLAASSDVIMDGRDIGTCVLPNADVKIYLTASVKTRAMRRWIELGSEKSVKTLDEIEADIAERDRRDMTREIAPLKQAEDAVLIDSSDMTIEEVVSSIIKLCRP